MSSPPQITSSRNVEAAVDTESLSRFAKGIKFLAENLHSTTGTLADADMSREIANEYSISATDKVDIVVLRTAIVTVVLMSRIDHRKARIAGIASLAIARSRGTETDGEIL